MKFARYSLLCAVALAILTSLHLLPAHGDDWLPISPADLALKDNLAQPGAHAMILYRQSVIDAARANIDGDSVSEYIRIKIFTQEGTKEADREIEFVKGESDVKDVRARTIHPDGTVVNFDGKVFEKTVVKVSGLKFLAKAFTLSDVQPGCIIEYKYRLQNKAQYLHDEHWTLSGSLFTREAHFSIIPYLRSDSYPLFYRQFGLPNGAVPERQANGSYTMVVHDILAIEDEPFMPPQRAIEARVDFYYRDLNEPANETVEHFWTRIGKKMNDVLEGYINKKGTLEKELARIVSPSDPPEVKLRKISARVQQIRDLAYEEQKSQKERKQENLKDNSNVEDVLKHGYGNGRQIDFLFVGLARAAGFEASEVYIAERSRNLFMPKLEDPAELNDDIVWVRAAGKEYWLDPAARYYPFGLLPWYETSTQGLRLNKQGGEFVDVPPPSSSDTVITRHADLEISDKAPSPASFRSISPVSERPSSESTIMKATRPAARSPLPITLKDGCRPAPVLKSPLWPIGRTRLSPSMSKAPSLFPISALPSVAASWFPSHCVSPATSKRSSPLAAPMPFIFISLIRKSTKSRFIRPPATASIRFPLQKSASPASSPTKFQLPRKATCSS